MPQVELTKDQLEVILIATAEYFKGNFDRPEELASYIVDNYGLAKAYQQARANKSL